MLGREQEAEEQPSPAGRGVCRGVEGGQEGTQTTVGRAAGRESQTGPRGGGGGSRFAGRLGGESGLGQQWIRTRVGSAGQDEGLRLKPKRKRRHWRVSHMAGTWPPAYFTNKFT